MLHVVTDETVVRRPDFAALAGALLAVLSGRGALHMRAHQLGAAELFHLADQLAATAAGSLLLINDRIDVAMAVQAHGVQLGARSLPVARARELLGPTAVIGYSAHAVVEAVRAQAEGANFVLMGTIYRSASHAGVQPAGLELVRNTVRACRIPVIAIGGVTAARIPELRAAGAAGVAVIRAVWTAGDPVQAAADLIRLLES